MNGKENNTRSGREKHFALIMASLLLVFAMICTGCAKQDPPQNDPKPSGEDDDSFLGIFDENDESLEWEVAIEGYDTHNGMKHHAYYDVELDDELKADLDELIEIFETGDPDTVFRKLDADPDEQDLLMDIYDRLEVLMDKKKGFDFVYDGYKIAFWFSEKNEKLIWNSCVAIIPEQGQGYFYESIYDLKYEYYRVGVVYADCSDYMFNGGYTETRFEQSMDRSFTYGSVSVGNTDDGFAHDTTEKTEDDGIVTTEYYVYGDVTGYSIRIRSDEEPEIIEDTLPTLYSFNGITTMTEGRYGHREILFY